MSVAAMCGSIDHNDTQPEEMTDELRFAVIDAGTVLVENWEPVARRGWLLYHLNRVCTRCVLGAGSSRSLELGGV